MALILIADDLTGACDAGALFAGRGRVGVFTDAAAMGSGWDVLALDTESRGLEPNEAATRVKEAARHLGPRLSRGVLFKKIDSTLRGAVGVELEALLSATGRGRALVCPAFPDQRRTVVDGILRVDGAPAHESAIGQDPTFPSGTSTVVQIVRRGASRPIGHLSLAQLRGGREALVNRLGGTVEEIIVADAETDADLAALAGAALAHPMLVLAGSAGLARAVAASLGYAGPPVPLPEGRAWLILAGSLHPATRAQIATLRAAGVAGASLDAAGAPELRDLIQGIDNGQPVFLATDDQDLAGARAGTAARLARMGAEILLHARPDLVAVTGGETAYALLLALGASRLELLGSPSSGLALGDVVAKGMSTVPLLTKGGGFGTPDLFVTLLKGSA